ncbi:SDR family NAD(P)-dependent oxidoreductase [Pseudomonadota bacterium]
MAEQNEFLSTLFSLKGKTALVTGASSGLGLEFARVLAKAGADVAIVARRTGRLNTAKKELVNSGFNICALPMDVADRHSVDETVDQIEESFAPVDILVNNAGVAEPQAFLEMSEQAWAEVIETNLNGVWRVSQAIARKMSQRATGGSIINIASILGVRTQRTQANYASAKAGVIQLTKTMAHELGRERIRVNAIAPGYFVTEMNKNFFASDAGNNYVHKLLPRRTGELSELSGALLLLASSAGSYITGVTLPVDGGTILSSL